jgi:hypothetical protein
LRQDQADYAAFFIHRSATYTMVVAIKDAIEAVVPVLPAVPSRKPQTGHRPEITRCSRERNAKTMAVLRERCCRGLSHRAPDQKRVLARSLGADLDDPACASRYGLLDSEHIDA